MSFEKDCGVCEGKGYHPFPGDVCTTCGGTGSIRIPGDPLDYVQCRNCFGKGYHPFPGYKCHVCRGTGLISKEQIRTVSPPQPSLPAGPPQESAEKRFDRIEEVLSQSDLEQPLAEMALYDLQQASIAYESKAYKACIVMLGAVLEGMMLGTLRREDVIQSMQTDPNPLKKIQQLGVRDPNLGDKIAEKLGFEDYKNALKHLIPDLEKEKAEAIQEFRNTLHPWKAIQEPNIYREPDETRALHLLAALEILARHIVDWKP